MSALSRYRNRRYRGLYGLAKAWHIARCAAELPHILVVEKNASAAEELRDDLEFFLGAHRVAYFPAWDTLPLEPASPLPDISAQRLLVLDRLHAGEELVVVTSVDSICQPVLPREFISSTSFKLTTGMTLGRAALIQKLDLAGFRRVPVVEEVGEMAVRGGVVDLFPSTTIDSNGPYPIRVELDDPQIDRIRAFNLETQRTTATLESAQITAVREIINFSELEPFRDLMPEIIGAIKARGKILETPPREIARAMSSVRSGAHQPGIELLQLIGLPTVANLTDYLHSDTLVMIDDQLAIKRELDLFSELVEERHARLAAEHILIPPTSLFCGATATLERLARFPCCYLDYLEVSESLDQPSDVNPIRAISNFELSTKLKTQVGTGHALAPLRQAITRWRRDGCRVAFIVGSHHRAERLQRLLLTITIDAAIIPAETARHASTPVAEWMANDHRAGVVILAGRVTAGVQLPGEKLVFVAEGEIFSDRSYRTARSSERALKRLMNSVAQLQDGDYVVHTDYGIGMYHGLVHLDVEGTNSDFLHIDYADSKLYLPIQQIGKIQKFAASEGKLPTLDKLSSTRWQRTKQKVRDSVVVLAGDLIKLYAARSVAKGWRYEPVGAEDERFADGFAYEETPDQRKAIKESLADMALDKPMDRLVCGDVGFGKTEVALRAAFKCIQHGRQVALLVPTTILVEQHKRTFIERFMEYQVKIGAVSRFYHSSINRQTLTELANGAVDIIVGTHRLLQRDVQFKDLGLVIIDEEHRFGVKQKEQLKLLRKQVDVLTLTATPIPRTLHMSLLGIRDVSVIATPPHDRRVIRTHVATHSEGLIRDAIMRELQRGGQCFFLHNRVQGIEIVAAELAALVPEARFRFAHGQMLEGQLAPIMQSFVNHEFDVLISTTIIESGLDIPNANTIILDRADMLGLAQLYQLRGRVGRSTRQAYAYLMIPPANRLSADAMKRLRALQSLDELGLGFNLAMQDMEIRGVGNLLGREQSGNVIAVGFDLYTRIVKEAVLNLKGEESPLEDTLDPEVKIGISAFIPDAYIPDISERLVLYQRLASLVDPFEADQLRDEITDRFGEFGVEVYNLIEIMRLRAVLRQCGVSKAEFARGRLLLAFSPRAPVDAQAMLALVRAKPKLYTLGKNLTVGVEWGAEMIADPAAVLPVVRELMERILVRTPVHESGVGL